MSAQPVAEETWFDARFPTGRVLTWDDLQSIPDDQHWRYQILEGQLLVSPAPDLRHQTCVLRLVVALDAVVPAHLMVVVSPFDFVPGPGYSLQPDVLVVDRARVERQRVIEPPLLVVEVLSLSSRSTDRSLKRMVYEEFGVPSYWIVDPVAPALTALDLVDGRYVETAHVRGEEAFEARVPYPVTVVPARLLDR